MVLPDGLLASNIRGTPTNRLYPAPDSGDDVFVLWPLTVLATNATTANDFNLEIVGELDGCYWFGGTDAAGATVSPEDYFEDTSGNRYRILPNGAQSSAAKPYQFFVLQEA